jgi:hypothetical protein
MGTLDNLLDTGQAVNFDLIFIDVDKPNHDAYYERAVRLARCGGLIVLEYLGRESPGRSIAGRGNEGCSCTQPEGTQRRSH